MTITAQKRGEQMEVYCDKVFVCSWTLKLLVLKLSGINPNWKALSKILIVITLGTIKKIKTVVKGKQGNGILEISNTKEDNNEDTERQERYKITESRKQNERCKMHLN